MLYFIAVWILLLVICGIIGSGTLSILKVDSFDRWGDRWILSEWIGMIVISVVLLGISIVLPVNAIVGAVSALILCTLAFTQVQTRHDITQCLNHLSRQKLMGGLALVVAIAAITAQEVTWMDTGLYHYSSVQWLNRFGTVRGLSLLFENLGFTSAWFALAAPFNPAILEARVSAVTNGFAYLLAALHFCVCMNYLIAGRGRIGDQFISVYYCLILLIHLFLQSSRTILISPSPDLPVLLFVGATAWAMLLNLNAFAPASKASAVDSPPVRSHSNGLIVPLFLATGSLSFKLTGLPIFLGAGLYFGVNHLVVNRGLNLRQLFTAVGVVMALLLPFLVVNVLTSGCLLYPSTAVCFDVPWSHDAETLQSVANDTHRWLTWYGTPPDGIHPWLWAAWQWVNEGHTFRAMAFLIGLSALLSGYVGKIAWSERRYELLWPVVISAIGIPFFMLTSPFNRFLLPYLFMTPSLAIVLYLTHRSHHQPHGSIPLPLKAFKHPLLHTLTPLFLAALLTAGSVRSNLVKLLIPPPMQQVPVAQTQINDIPYRLPLDEALCWATDIPCAYGVRQDITFRDPERGLRAGFVQRVQ
ncbi:LIC_10190 family membrane protein [Egbenema bharatensis]|uniref:LIC_10190 family membrane protein n=1 Tax=Egbenema bharatensis TaxID=3463334 RepID=UPI003A861EB2